MILLLLRTIRYIKKKHRGSVYIDKNNIDEYIGVTN